ncbi:MAG: multiheme c-type cytochrome [Polyangiaceae bacterium]
MTSFRALLPATLLVAATVTAGAKATKPDFPHPGPPQGSATARANHDETCARCHAEIDKEWQQSWHRKSFTNEEFRASLEREPPPTRPLCIRCHAPELTGDAPSPDRAHQVGVTCVTCHLPDGDPDQPPLRVNAAGGNVPHPPLRPSSSLRDVAGCAACHEFKFITPRPSYAREPSQWMQRTVREHYDGQVGDLTCTTCHMPQVVKPRRHHDHRFLGGHDDGMLHRAVEITATRPNPGLVQVVVTPKRVSHAVPTGDLFRRIAVYLEPIAYTPVQGPYARFLARHHERIEGGQRLEMRDDRPFQIPTVLDFELDYSWLAESLDYRVVYERVAYLRGDDERRAAVFQSRHPGAREIAYGTLREEIATNVAGRHGGLAAGHNCDVMASKYFHLSRMPDHNRARKFGRNVPSR